MSEERSDIQKQVKNLNMWMYVCVVFIITYTVSMLVFVEKGAIAAHNNPQIYIIDPQTMQISPAYSNLFYNNPMESGTNATVINETNRVNDINTSNTPLFRQKPSYEIGDFVVIRFFLIEAIITSRMGNDYTIMYKDNNRVIQKITMNSYFILSSAEPRSMNPLKFLAD